MHHHSSRSTVSWPLCDGPHPTEREVSPEMIFFLQVMSKNSSMQKKKSILNDMLFITPGSGVKGDRNFPLASIGVDCMQGGRLGRGADLQNGG